MARVWIGIGVVLLAVILIPYFRYEGEVAGWTERITRSPSARWTLAVLIASLLALDVFLPVPSSVVSLAAGALLGFWPATLAVWTGMSAGCLLGYAAGAGVGRFAARRILRPAELERVERASARFGPWTIVLFRAVPVMAEASVLFAGLTRMPLALFGALSAGANLVVAAGYAWAGSRIG